MSDKNPLLEISPYEIDGGQVIGRRPEEVPPEILALNFSAQNPLKALRARCLDCCAGEASEVRKCVAIECPSWPYRMGTDPFRKKMQLSEEEKQRRAARLQGAPPGSQNETPARHALKQGDLRADVLPADRLTIIDGGAP